MPEVTRAKTLHQGQFNRLIKITQATSRYPERDVLVLIVQIDAWPEEVESARVAQSPVDRLCQYGHNPT